MVGLPASSAISSFLRQDINELVGAILIPVAMFVGDMLQISMLWVRAEGSALQIRVRLRR